MAKKIKYQNHNLKKKKHHDGQSKIQPSIYLCILCILIQPLSLNINM